MPHVPGAEVAVFERGDLRHHEYEGSHQDRLDAAYRLVELAAEHGSMTRLPRRVPDIRPERQRPRYLGALHPAAAPPERRRRSVQPPRHSPFHDAADRHPRYPQQAAHRRPVRHLRQIRRQFLEPRREHTAAARPRHLLHLHPAATPARHPPRRIPQPRWHPAP